MYFEHLHDCFHILEASLTNALSTERGIILDPRVIEGLLSSESLFHIFLDQALQEVLGLLRVS